MTSYWCGSLILILPAFAQDGEPRQAIEAAEASPRASPLHPHLTGTLSMPGRRLMITVFNLVMLGNPRAWETSKEDTTAHPTVRMIC